MTLTQLSAFVLVARLGSVSAAAHALDVSEPAVSQALAALRRHFGDPLLVRGAGGMTLTAGGSRLLTIATQMVALGADADAGVRAARGAAEQLRLIAASPLAEFVMPPLVEAFTERNGRKIETTAGAAATAEMPVLVANRLADLAVGPRLDNGGELTGEPVFRARLVVVVGSTRPVGAMSGWPWLVDASGTDPNSDCGKLLRALHVAEPGIRVFPNQTAAGQRRRTARARPPRSNTWWPAGCEGASYGCWKPRSRRCRPRGTSRAYHPAAAPRPRTPSCTSSARQWRCA